MLIPMEALATYKEAKFSKYLIKHLEKAKKHFDVNRVGKIEALKATESIFQSNNPTVIIPSNTPTLNLCTDKKYKLEIQNTLALILLMNNKSKPL